MKKFFYTVVFFVLNCHAQIGNQTKRLFATTQYGHTKWGLYKLPDSSTVKYPVIVFMHGLGEVGSTERDLVKLLTNGTPWVLAQGNVLQGQQVKFISLALQDKYWSPTIEEVMYVLRNDIVLKDRVDWRGIFITGLSAGGQNCINSLLTSQGITDSIAGIVPMSAAGGITWQNIAWARTKPVWAFHGLQDQTCPYQITQRFCDSVLPSKWTQAPDTHCCWNSYYVPTYRETIDGLSMNIYEWMAIRYSVRVLSIQVHPAIKPKEYEWEIKDRVIKIKMNTYSHFNIYSTDGRLVMNGQLKIGNNEIKLKLIPGIYFFQTLYFSKILNL